ncbi:VOC family protein [Cupriavidus sp. 2TAF22]|uniref:VOC family protein n=1 Tax=unclassified Cupriavidus TaxID=2640874 RepID=UPI003F8EC4FC
MSQKFGGVRQVGYVVRDIKAAMAHWVNLGIGPWFYMDDVGTREFRYFGENSRLPKLSIALANSGDLQIELIQQRDDAPSLYNDSLKRNGEIAQHVAYWTEDRYDEIVATLLGLGYVEGHGGRMGGAGRFAYFVHPDFPSGMFEISEMAGGKAQYFEAIRQAGLAWDGSDPVRIVEVPPAAAQTGAGD